MANTRSRQSIEPETQPTAPHSKPPAAERAKRAPEPARPVGRSRSRQAEHTPVPVAAAKKQKATTTKARKAVQKGAPSESGDRDTGRARKNAGKGKQPMSPMSPVREEENAHAQELDEARTIDAEMAIAEIPELQGSAEKLIRILLDDKRDVAALREDLSKSTRLQKSLYNRRRGFEIPKAHFGIREYISPRVIRSVVGTEAYHPVLYHANLAVMAVFFCSAHRRTAFEELEALDRAFPDLIGESITQENFSLVLDLRTQAFISALMNKHEEDDFDPNALLSEFFFENGARGHALRQYRSYAGSMNYEGYKADTRSRVNELMRFVIQYEGNRGIDLGPLLETYSWDKFAQSMVEYFRKLTRDAGRRESIAAAVEKAQAFDGTIPAEQDDREPPVSEKPAVSPAKNKGKGKQPRKSIEFFTSLIEETTEEFGDDVESSVYVQPPTSPQATPHNLPMFNDEPSPPPPTAADYKQLIHKIGNDGNKENRPAPEPVVAGPSKGFLDRQRDATKVQWTSEPEDSQPPPSPQQQQQHRTKKRRAQEEEEESDDDDFGPDDREEDEDRRKRIRRDTVSQSARPSGASVRTSGAQSARMSGTRNSGASASSSAPPPVRASVAPRTSNASVRTDGSNGRISGVSAPGRSEIPHNELVPEHIGLPGERLGSAEPEGSDEEEPRRLSAAMIRNLDQINRRTRGRNVHQGRQPWTDEQTQTLINLIGRYGPDWSRIQGLQHEDLLGRTNVNLKDKARNIKIQYLRNKLPLPAGFRNVTISEKDREQLLVKYGVRAGDYEDDCPDYAQGYLSDEEVEGEE